MAQVNTQRLPEPLNFNAAVFDIETMDFSTGGLGNFLVCVSILPLNAEQPFTLRLEFEDENDDRRLLEHVIDELSQYEILIGHNIAAFDYNWLLSRLAYHGMPYPDKRWLYYDTYQAARRMAIKADRKSLAFLCDFFGVPFVKTGLYPVQRTGVLSRSKTEFDAAIEMDVYHCEQDVLANRHLFNIMYPRDRGMKNLPRFNK